MNAWITVHYPHPYDDSLPWRIYLREKELEQGRRVMRGDLVLLNLTESGPPSEAYWQVS